MLDSKLTLKLNTDSISRAKTFSAENGVSLSSMVEKFFDGLTLQNKNKTADFQYSSLVSELSGIISVPEDFDYKADYLEHLESKYE